MLKRAHIFVSGLVQGVCYRWFTEEKANKLGLTGWVKNLWDGRVEVVVEGEEGEIVLSRLETGDVFGEMALFTGEPRSASVRAKGSARVLTVDKKGFLRRVHEDPSLAFHILQRMSERIQALDQEVVRLRSRQQ